MARSAGVILDDAVAKTGWSTDAQLEVLLEYIENQGSNEVFADFLAERVSTDIDNSEGG